MATRRCCALALLVLFTSPLLATEPTGAQRLGKLLADPDKDACISLTTDSERWRDATAADYGSSGWAAWRKYTKSDTPWQARGDFDGDGLQDVAKVIVDKAGERWMQDFGRAGRCGHDAHDCRIRRRYAQPHHVRYGQRNSRVPAQWRQNMDQS